MRQNLALYDDRRELAEYLWSNYSQLFSEPEQLAARTLIGEQKATTTDSERIRQKLLSAWSRRGEPEIDVLLADGPEAFRIQAAERVLAERRDEIDVNRCPECDRVVATPRARQCLWCGFDWHEVPPNN